MKKKLYLFFKRFFLKEIVEENANLIASYVKEQCDDKEEIRMLKQAQRWCELVEYIFLAYPSAKILGIRKNKIGEKFYVVDTGNTIYLYNWHYINSKPRLHYDLIYNEGTPTEIKIVDVLMSQNNVGHGTICMEYLLDIAKKTKVATIWGEMAPDDDDHAERRAHYYEKFGFKIADRKATLIMEE